VQWNRLGIAGRPRLGFLPVLFVLCSRRMISNLLLASAKGDKVLAVRSIRGIRRQGGRQNKLQDILKGEYKHWAAVFLRSVDLQKFPLRWAALLGLESECVFFSDYDPGKSSGESAK
jgi:hypothetical protein